MADAVRRTGAVDPIARIAERFSGDLQIAAFEVRSGARLLVRADEVAPTASVIKIPILVEVYRQARERILSLAERVQLRSEAQIGGSGILKELCAGLQPTIADLATLMVVVSDNTATNLLIDCIGGVEPVNTTMRTLGFETVVLHHRLGVHATGDRSDTRGIGEASPFDLARLMQGLVQGAVVDPPASEAILKLMRSQQYLDQVPRYLNINPYAHELSITPPLEVASKTGFSAGRRVDIGALFLGDHAIVAYCVAATGGDDLTFAPENEGAVVNGLVGRELVRRWWPRDAGPPPLLRTAYDARD